MCKKIRVLFIDDRANSLRAIEEIFNADDEKAFKLADNKSFSDQDGKSYLSEDDQKKSIIDAIKNYDNYDVILCDLYLRDDEEVLHPKDMDNVVSISIYKEMEETLKQNNKRFAFITSHDKWPTIAYRDIPGVKGDWVFFNRPINYLNDILSDPDYIECPYKHKGSYDCNNELIEPPCGITVCFLARLRRFCDNG